MELQSSWGKGNIGLNSLSSALWCVSVSVSVSVCVRVCMCVCVSCVCRVGCSSDSVTSYDRSSASLMLPWVKAVRPSLTEFRIAALNLCEIVCVREKEGGDSRRVAVFLLFL